MIDDIFCARLCRESYHDPIPEGFCDVDDLRFGVRQKDGVTYIAFRGSANLLNWVRNLRIFPAKTPRGHMAHRGFVKGFERLNKYIKVSGPTVFTGHSLGGGLATLFAEAHRVPLVTFGSPRVYVRWGEGPNLMHRRYVTDDDPVPMVPRYLYSHKCVPIVLPDNDGGIDWEDHDLEGAYIARMTA